MLVHSAGGPVPGGLFDVSPETWYAAFEVHVHAVFHLCRSAIPHMRARKQGAIVLVSSTAGIRAVKTNVAYQAVKRRRCLTCRGRWRSSLLTTTSA